MDDKVQRSWENVLNPEVLRPNLIIASIYIAAFELLKDAIVERIRDFYVVGFDQNGPRIGPAYQSEVLSRNRSPVYASLDWLKESKAITDDDIETFENVKTLRNDLAHGIVRMLTQGLPSSLPAALSEMISLLDKIERWWIVNVEIATDPDSQNKEVDAEQVIPGTIMSLRLMVDIALGPEEESRRYINEFIRQTRPPDVGS